MWTCNSKLLTAQAKRESEIFPLMDLLASQTDLIQRWGMNHSGKPLFLSWLPNRLWLYIKVATVHTLDYDDSASSDHRSYPMPSSSSLDDPIKAVLRAGLRLGLSITAWKKLDFVFAWPIAKVQLLKSNILISELFLVGLSSHPCDLRGDSQAMLETLRIEKFNLENLTRATDRCSWDKLRDYVHGCRARYQLYDQSQYTSNPCFCQHDAKHFSLTTTVVFKRTR